MKSNSAMEATFAGVMVKLSNTEEMTSCRLVTRSWAKGQVALLLVCLKLDHQVVARPCMIQMPPRVLNASLSTRRSSLPCQATAKAVLK